MNTCFYYFIPLIKDIYDNLQRQAFACYSPEVAELRNRERRLTYSISAAKF